MSGPNEAWIGHVSRLTARLWGLGEETSPYLRVLRFERAPPDLASEIQSALQAVRSEGVVLVIVHAAAELTGALANVGVHELTGGARLVAQPIPRGGPRHASGPLWLGLATRALEKVAPARALLSQIATPPTSETAGPAAGAAVLIALECGAPSAAEGLQHLAPNDISPDLLLQVQALWRWNLAQSEALKDRLQAAAGQISEATARAARAEHTLDVARADHRANIARLTQAPAEAPPLAVPPPAPTASLARSADAVSPSEGGR